jgi:hypothetical protein
MFHNLIKALGRTPLDGWSAHRNSPPYNNTNNLNFCATKKMWVTEKFCFNFPNQVKSCVWHELKCTVVIYWPSCKPGCRLSPHGTSQAVNKATVAEVFHYYKTWRFFNIMTQKPHWTTFWATRPFWDTVPYSLTDADWHFRGAYCLQHHPDNGGNMHLWNVDQLLYDHTAQCQRRLSFSYSPLHEPQISLRYSFFIYLTAFHQLIKP